MTKPLTVKERRFVDAYLCSARGNGTAAARAAGYSGDQKVLGIQATRLLARASIRAVIEARQTVEERHSVLTATEKDEMLSMIARSTSLPAAARIRAIAELNRCTGRHSVRHHVQSRLTLEQVLAESRK